MKNFDITYYWGPHGENMYNEYFISKIKECGFTSIPLENGTVEDNKKALALLRKYGITCSALYDRRIDDAAGHDREVSPDTTQQEIDQIVCAVVEEYREYSDVIKGWWLQDEPCEARFSILGKIVKAFRKYAKDTETMINLLPTYANNAQLGTNGYQEYLDEFVKQVDPHYISYDHYHFRKKKNPRPGFFKNLEYIRNKAAESNIDPMIIILVTEHMSYANLTHEQIKWEVNTSLAYGMKRISYFTFILDPDLLADGWNDALMCHTGEIYPHYYDVQKINKWLLPLGNELFAKKSTAVFHVKENTEQELEPKCTEYSSYGSLGKIDGKNFLIGFFDDGSFMITNKHFEPEIAPNGDKICESPFVFLDIDNGLEYFNTDTAAWCDAEADGIVRRNESGKLTRCFDVAEGILFRVAK